MYSIIMKSVRIVELILYYYFVLCTQVRSHTEHNMHNLSGGVPMAVLKEGK